VQFELSNKTLEALQIKRRRLRKRSGRACACGKGACGSTSLFLTNRVRHAFADGRGSGPTCQGSHAGLGSWQPLPLWPGNNAAVFRTAGYGENGGGRGHRQPNWPARCLPPIIRRSKTVTLATPRKNIVRMFSMAQTATARFFSGTKPTRCSTTAMPLYIPGKYAT